MPQEGSASLQAKSLCVLLMQFDRQGLSEDIRSILTGIHPLQLNELQLNGFSDEVVADIDVLCTIVVLQVFGEFNSAIVIKQD